MFPPNLPGRDKQGLPGRREMKADGDQKPSDEHNPLVMADIAIENGHL